ncbi:DUF4133 domain-containing protein [Marinilongibacter aquaticus]|uniref:DUF4133 domain-containing protein n=1 Tax=Marinilongibacter aquaticus TaxID=2975157 RepID=UPI0021BDB554|nr:DUF4133 domain-containing protein [Marinilongibacter aquaticus]UBM58722.1 DUF4133 domain-containing protein [Marinilongibacter aquaticus]
MGSAEGRTATSSYTVNKGINRSIEFKGLKAQYIWYLGGGMAVLLVLTTAMYLSGIPSPACMATAAACGTALILLSYRMSRKYGEHGLMKTWASKRIPRAVRCRRREVFLHPGKKTNENRP